MLSILHCHKCFPVYIIEYNILFIDIILYMAISNIIFYCVSFNFNRHIIYGCITFAGFK